MKNSFRADKKGTSNSGIPDIKNEYSDVVSLSFHVVLPWPTIFTWPNITHFEEKNSRPDV